MNFDPHKTLPRDPRLHMTPCTGDCGILIGQGTMCQSCIGARPLPVRTLARRPTSDRAVVALAVGALVIVATLALWPHDVPQQTAVDTETIDAQPYTPADVAAKGGKR